MRFEMFFFLSDISLDRYLVGQRLVNYERKSGRTSSVPPSNPVAE